MTRVCVVRHGPFWSDPRVARQAVALAGVPGVGVDVYARGPEPDPPGEPRGLTVHTLSARPPSERPLVLALQALRFGLRSLWLALRTRPPYDVVIVHSIPSWLLLLLSPLRVRRRQTRLILDHHEPETEMLVEAGVPTPVASAYRHLERLAVRRADAVVDVSDSMRDRSAVLGARRQIVVDNAPALHRPPGPPGDPPDTDLAVFGSLIHRYDLPVLREALGGLGHEVSILQAGGGQARLDSNPSCGPMRSFDHLPPAQLQAELARCRFGFVGLAPSRFTALVSPNRLFELSALAIPSIVARTDLIERLLGPWAVYYEGGSVASLHAAFRRSLAMGEEERLALGSAAERRLRSRQWSNQALPYVRFCLAGTNPTPLDQPAIPRGLKAAVPEADIRGDERAAGPGRARHRERRGA